ncbi:MAG: right-handed parallel beta-helix repeat-containing protein, partial [Thermodesulfobacteriota bacterium]
NVIVRSGATLTIEPGVTVNFNADKSLQIDGGLIAKGTGASPITFTAPTTDKWAYILFNDSSTDAAYNSSTGDYASGSIMEYCTVEYAGGTSVSDNGAIRLNGAHPFINYCPIRNNSASGIYAYNISSALKITNNTISGNTASSSSYYSYCYGGGIYVYGGTVTLTNNTISGNTASSSYSSYSSYYSQGGGISNDGTMTLTNNTISNNTAEDAAAVYYASGDGKNFQYNTITGNESTGSGYAAVYVNAYPLINYNYIYDNTATYELWFNKSQGSANLDAKNNWWGSSDETAILGKIYDGIDDSTRALVDYYPYSTAIRTDTGATTGTTTPTPTPTPSPSPSPTP